MNEFIFNAAVNKIPVYDAYKQLCEKQNNSNYDYVEFSKRSYSDSPKYKIQKLKNVDGEICDLMMADVSSILNNSKLEINCFAVELVSTMNSKGFFEFWNSLNFLISAEQVIIEVEQEEFVYDILKKIKPVVLKEIQIENLTPKIEQIFELEQWKKAEILRCGRVSDECSIEKLFHFKQFDTGEIRLTEERLLKIKDILLKSTDFESCSLKTDPEHYHSEHTMAKVKIIWRHDPLYNSVKGQFSIPNSLECFQVSFIRGRLHINKKDSSTNMHNDEPLRRRRLERLRWWDMFVV